MVLMKSFDGSIINAENVIKFYISDSIPDEVLDGIDTSVDDSGMNYIVYGIYAILPVIGDRPIHELICIGDKSECEERLSKLPSEIRSKSIQNCLDAIADILHDTMEVKIKSESNLLNF